MSHQNVRREFKGDYVHVGEKRPFAGRVSIRILEEIMMSIAEELPGNVEEKTARISEREGITTRSVTKVWKVATEVEEGGRESDKSTQLMEEDSRKD